MLDRNDIKTLKTFRYARISRVASSTRVSQDDRDFIGVDNMFERPLVLSRLATFITDVKVRLMQ
jgi:hypothetical protein